MKNKLTAKTSISINTSPERVWETLTTPTLIKMYLMGTDVTSDWKEGSAITYTGEYNGKKYKDKGIIKKMVPGELFQSTYWSSNSGKPDKPENYNTVTYKIKESGRKTTVFLSQDNIGSKKEKEHSTANWKAVLKKMKEVAEEKIKN